MPQAVESNPPPPTHPQMYSTYDSDTHTGILTGPRKLVHCAEILVWSWGGEM